MNKLIMMFLLLPMLAFGNVEVIKVEVIQDTKSYVTNNGHRKLNKSLNKYSDDMVIEYYLDNGYKIIHINNDNSSDFNVTTIYFKKI